MKKTIVLTLVLAFFNVFTLSCDEEEPKHCTNSGCLQLCAKLTACGGYESAEECTQSMPDCDPHSTFDLCLPLSCDDFFGCYANPNAYDDDMYHMVFSGANNC